MSAVTVFQRRGSAWSNFVLWSLGWFGAHVEGGVLVNETKKFEKTVFTQSSSMVAYFCHEIAR